MSITENGTIKALVVEPGFNSVGIEDAIQALQAPAAMNIFDPNTQEVLTRKEPFALVLGKGFENNAVIREGLAGVRCMGLASVDQLRFLQEHGMQKIVMATLHGTLAQNARALGIQVQVLKGGTGE